MYNYNYHQNPRRNNAINTGAIANQLSQHFINRVKLQQEQDRLWNLVKRGQSCATALKSVDRKIGENTYAIDGLISKLIKARCRSGKAYSMAVKYLKSEIARNQRIISSWDYKIREVESGRSHWIDASGRVHYDSTFAYRYLAKKKEKTAQLQRQLSQLIG